MSRIAMFGGSFNPVHNGHTGLVERMVREFSLDKVYVIPTFHTPLKDNSHMITPVHRLNMCRLAFGFMDKVVVSDLEIARQGRSYTVDTLSTLKEIHPDDDLYLIMGADSFMQLPMWHKADEIFDTATILTVSRGEVEYNTLLKQKEEYSLRYGANAQILKEPIALVSSTEVRQAVSMGRDLSGMLHPEVSGYIYKNRLYEYGHEEIL